jgi:DnaD/phage-associated family protein
MADYWIKLYHEIIDDPKMATLPDRLWRRVIELFLLAGKLSANKSGELPDTRQLAWLLRMPTDELATDLDMLKNTGIVQPIPGGWIVSNFEKRQRAASASERVRQHRERQQKRQYQEGETFLERNVTQINRAEQSRAEAEAEPLPPPPRSELFRLYEREIGPLTPMISDRLKAAERDYPVDWFPLAFQEATTHNARNWKYIEAILGRWKTDGFAGVGKRNGGASKANSEKERLADARTSIYGGQL